MATIASVTAFADDKKNSWRTIVMRKDCYTLKDIDTAVSQALLSEATMITIVKSKLWSRK